MQLYYNYLFLSESGNFIDKTFTVLADLILKILPTSEEDKKAFAYYRSGMAAQEQGKYAEALLNYYKALHFEENPIDRSYILYNIGIIHQNVGDFVKALSFYEESLELNSFLPQALNNMAVIYHFIGKKEFENTNYESSTYNFRKSATLWRRAIKMSPNGYVEAQNWLKINNL